MWFANLIALLRKIRLHINLWVYKVIQEWQEKVLHYL